VSSNSGAIELRAPAKLNLFLEVLGRRPDGYHELRSLFRTVDLYDRLRFERAEGISLTVEGDAPADRTNLVWRAAEALGVGARIRLSKSIPAGAGLGGGSSDAAATLRALNRLYGLGHPAERLREIGGRLGADVPFFLVGGAAWCGGKGELVEPLRPSPPGRYLLVCPPFPTSTAAVYAALDGMPREGSGLIPPAEGATVRGGRKGPDLPIRFNRLEAAAERLDPRLREVRVAAERAYGLRFTMTGSGSAYFADLGEGAPPPGPAGPSPRDGFRAAGVAVRTWIVSGVELPDLG